ncbi:hypothetical protein A3731_07875 [Roseovarius sp. HI0049]|nr:hypothetical protein A3731_07875 [Roseovarius sp. HI0049]
MAISGFVIVQELSPTLPSGLLQPVEKGPGIQRRAPHQPQRGGGDLLAALGVLANGASGCACFLGLIIGKRRVANFATLLGAVPSMPRLGMQRQISRLPLGRKGRLLGGGQFCPRALFVALCRMVKRT